MANSQAAKGHRTGHRKPRQRPVSPLTRSFDPHSLPSSESDCASSSTEDLPSAHRSRNRLSRIEDVAELDVQLVSLTRSCSTHPTITPPSSDPPTLPPKHVKPGPLKPKRIKPRPHTPPLQIPQPVSPSPPPMRPVRLLVASLGNPPPYQSTRHSAAHILLKALAQRLNFPSLVKSKTHGGGSVSSGADVGRPEYTLWQSGSQMNVSGIGLLKAWHTFLSSQQRDQFEGVEGLIILHDELELEPGKIKIRRGETSAKGHNGIKSVQQSLKGANVLGKLGSGDKSRFVKIAVGIGRPQSRERDDVSAFVLGQVTRTEREGIESRVESGEFESVLEQEMERMSVL